MKTDNRVPITDGDQQESGVGILVLRFGCLTACTAVSSILGTPVEGHTQDSVQGLARCWKQLPSPHGMGQMDWILQKSVQGWDDDASTTWNLYLSGPWETPDTTLPTLTSNPSDPLSQHGVHHTQLVIDLPINLPNYSDPMGTHIDTSALVPGSQQTVDISSYMGYKLEPISNVKLYPHADGTINPGDLNSYHDIFEDNRKVEFCIVSQCLANSGRLELSH